MLGTSTTFILLAGLLLPAGLAAFVNRRKKEDYNPFIWGIWGLGSTLVVSLLFLAGSESTKIHKDCGVVFQFG